MSEPSSIDAEGTTHAAASLPPGHFEVRLARRGLQVTVPPEQSIVQALEAAGVVVPTSCQAGLCGTCTTAYLEGEVEHADFILEADEQARCLTPCVSRASSALLVLDL